MQYPWLSTIQQQLNASINRKALHHALLFVGGQALGTHELMTHFAKQLLCQISPLQPCGHCKGCQLMNAGNHPDFHLIEADKQIGVDAIRSGIQSIQSSASMGVKVLMIVNAHTMTESASNALLKTLEEPTDNTYLLLDTPSLKSLLPTITSRCQHLMLPIPSVQQVRDWLTERGLSVADNTMKAYRAKPLLLTDDEHVNFDIFYSELDNLTAPAVPELAGRMAKHIDSWLPWFKQWLNHRCLTTIDKQSLWLDVYQDCMDRSPSLAHVGTNNTLILMQLLKKVADTHHSS